MLDLLADRGRERMVAGEPAADLDVAPAGLHEHRPRHVQRQEPALPGEGEDAFAGRIQQQAVARPDQRAFAVVVDLKLARGLDEAEDVLGPVAADALPVAADRLDVAGDVGHVEPVELARMDQPADRALPLARHALIMATDAVQIGAPPVELPHFGHSRKRLPAPSR